MHMPQVGLGKVEKILGLLGHTQTLDSLGEYYKRVPSPGHGLFTRTEKSLRTRNKKY